MARYPEAEWHPSPNYGYPQGEHGRNGESVRFYEEHTTASDAGKLAHRAWFLKPDNVAPHFCVFKDGTIDQYADTEDAPWHTNPVANPDTHLNLYTTNANLVTIGIEWQGQPGQLLTEPQILAGIKLHRWLNDAHPLFKIDREHVIGHYQINSVDKANDPGPAFPWDRLLAGMKGDDMVFNDDDKTDLANARDVVRGWGAYLSEAAKVKAPLLFKDGPGKELTEAAATLDRILGSLQ